MANPAHPVVPTPDLRLGDVPDICSYGPRPHLLTGALVQFFRAHFADRQGIEEPPLRDWLWRADEATGIVVESITRWRPGVAMARPALVVKRNGWRVQRRGLDDRLQGYISSDGFDYYVTFIQGSHTLFSLAAEAGEAERLGSEAYRELIQFGPLLREHFRLHRFVVAEHGALGRLPGEATNAYVVPTTVAYTFEEAWTIAPQAPVLKRIAIEAIVTDAL